MRPVRRLENLDSIFSRPLFCLELPKSSAKSHFQEAEPCLRLPSLGRGEGRQHRPFRLLVDYAAMSERVWEKTRRQRCT